jgi:hypothetical protein
MLKDPFTGQPSIPFTLYAMECEGVMDEEEEDEEEDVEQED